jgi:hypothetical protein
MDITAPSRVSITSSRYLHRAQNVRLYRKPEVGAKEVGLQEKDQQSIMGQGHRIYHHRREAQAATRILTVNVEVVATVDTSGNVVVQETVTQAAPTVPTLPAAIHTPQVAVPSVAVIPVVSAVIGAGGALVSVAAAPVVPAVSAVVAGVEALVPSMPSGLAPPVVSANPALPQVPSVPPFPTDALPVVPSVPPFPSNLNVPAYPWPSGVVSAQAIPVSITPATSSSTYTTGTESSASHVPISTPYPASNSTVSSVRPSVSTSTGTLLSTLNSLSSNFSQLASSVSGPSSESLSATVTSSFSSSVASASYPLGTATSQGAAGTNYGAGGGGPANTAASPAQTNVAAGAGATSSSPPLQTPQVVGSVVGSLAGVALILAVLLFLLRRHKQRQRGTLQLTEDDVPGSAQPITQDMSRNNRIPSAFLHRFSGMSRSTAETSTSGGERSFQRISGRKLPSAFSEGMTSEQFSRGGTMSESSFYQDDHGIYGGQGLSKEMEKEIEGTPTATGASAMTFRPGPARTPIIRHPEDINPFADPAPFPGSTSHLSPPQSPNPDIRRGTLGRSLASADGSRSSKFTENV